uniref:Mos1 transposase HTH domain-containing protein n=1 Tax=Eptatretus burgeri TaxID=7764 RepID=A0A8C4Q4B9_EPTBU
MSREQRANMKFLAKLGKTSSESFTMLQQVNGEETMSRTCAFEWHKRFKEGREEVEDNPQSGRPSTSRMADNIERVKQMVCADHRLTVRMIAEEFSINKDTVWSIISENLEMHKVCAKMVPKLLSEDQKQQRVTVCEDIIERLEDDPDLLGRVITGDESWIFEYNPKTKRQSRQWKSPASPRPKKARMSKSKVKVMLIAFFDIKGIVHFEFLPQGETVNQYMYKEILRRLMRSARDKRRDLWENNAWVLHHDNTPAHSALSIRQFLVERNVPTLEQPPDSPALVPCDVFRFPKSRG